MTLTPRSALAVVWDALKSDLPGGAKKAFLEEADSVLGLDLFKIEAVGAVPADIVALLIKRAEAKAGKDFADRTGSASRSRSWVIWSKTAKTAPRR